MSVPKTMLPKDPLPIFLPIRYLPPTITSSSSILFYKSNYLIIILHLLLLLNDIPFGIYGLLQPIKVLYAVPYHHQLSQRICPTQTHIVKILGGFPLQPLIPRTHLFRDKHLPLNALLMQVLNRHQYLPMLSRLQQLLSRLVLTLSHQPPLLVLYEFQLLLPHSYLIVQGHLLCRHLLVVLSYLPVKLILLVSKVITVLL